MRRPSSTSVSSIRLPLPPKLERLLLDGDTTPEIEPLLRGVGFDTESVRRIDVDIRNDTAILRRARADRRILVCHDLHRDRETRQFLFTEMYKNGGRVLRIGGDSSRDPLEQIGKLLMWREQWTAFFKENRAGAVTVHRDRIVKKTARELYTLVQREMRLVVEPAEALAHVPPKPASATRRREKPKEQLILPS